MNSSLTRAISVFLIALIIISNLPMGVSADKIEALPQVANENQVNLQSSVETLETIYESVYSTSPVEPTIIYTPSNTNSITSEATRSPTPSPTQSTVKIGEQTLPATNELCKVVFKGSGFQINNINLDVAPSKAIDEIALVPEAGYVCPETVIVNGKILKSVTDVAYGITYDRLSGTISGIPSEKLTTIEADALVDNACVIADSTDTTANVLIDIGPSNKTINGIVIKTGNNDYGSLIPFVGSVRNGKSLFKLTGLSPDTTYIVQPKYNDNKLGKTFIFSTRTFQPVGISSIWNGSILDVKGINNLKTTYSNKGWGFDRVFDSNVQSFITTYNLSQNVNEVTIVLRNNGSSVVSNQKFAFHADVQIGSNDRAPISNIQNQGFMMTDGVNKLYIINQGNGIKNGHNPFGGITAATTTKWWGYYGNRTSYLYTDLSGHSDLSGTDSGAAFSWQNISLEPGETRVYTFKIAAGSYESEDLSDVEAPTEPKGLEVESKDTENIKISWTESSDNNGVAGYRVYRDGILIKTVTGTSFEDSGLIPGTSYTYTVKAYDFVGNTSNSSESLAVTTLIDNEPPSIISIEPVNGSVIGKSTQIVVKATDNIKLKSIKLQYALEGSEQWNDIETIDTLNTARFSLENLQINGKFSVRAIAYDKAKNESQSNIVRSYTRDIVGPEKIVNIRAESSSTSILLNWDDVSDNDLSYFQVEKKNDDGTYTSVGTVSNARGMNVTGLKVSTTYTFRIVGYDRVQNRGIPSDDVTFSTTADTTAPVVTYIGPSPARFSASIPVRVNVSDDVGAVQATFQISSNGTDWTDLNTISSQSNSYTQPVDVSALTEGKYYIRCLVEDAAGNISNGKPVNEYIVDRTAPGVPQNLSVVPSAGYIDLIWTQNSEVDFRYYKLYRSKNQEPYVLIVDNYRYLSYRDRNVSADVQYQYKLTAVDSCGNESESVTSNEYSIIEDNEAPHIISSSYADQSTLPANPKIRVLAEDNYMLESLKLEYRLASDEQQNWTTINNVTSINKYSDVVEFAWNTSGLSDDTYVIRAIATDKKGNKSNPYSVTYSLNLEPPTAPIVTANPGGWKVNLAWTASPEVDIAGYHVYRSNTIDGSYTLLTKTTNTSYEDTTVIAGNTYYYMVEAADKYYNVAKSQKVSAVPTNEDHELPKAVINCRDAALTGDSIIFDGTSSTDNNQITRVVWDFGDGNTSELLKAVHTYSAPGEYTVSLTVYDPADNTNSIQKKVIIHPQGEVSQVKIQIIDDATGTGVANASVVINNADGTIANTQADAEGIVNLIAAFKEGENTGKIKVYAFKQGYQPSKLERTITAGQPSNVVLNLSKGELVEGELTFKRMTLDEIKKANINISAPENQYVYEFTVHLGYPVVVNSSGQILSNSTYTITNSSSSNRSVSRVYVNTIPSSRPEVPPAITYMEVPGEMTMLKEFFNVNLTVENLAKDSEFKIENSIANLNLPSGLKLVNSGAKVSLTPSVIPGGSKGTANWIVRGDEEGEYDISADFSGVLQPFNELVTKTFVAKDKIKVYGTSDITIHCEAENVGYRNDPYLVRFGVENTAPISRYNVTFTLKDGVNYTYKEGQQLKQSITELKPNEIKWFEYWLLPDGDLAGPLDLKETFVLNASDDSVKWIFTSIPRSRGDGFAAWYFESKDLCGTYKQKTEEKIDFDWGTNGSPDPAINSTEFSARWQGIVIPKYEEDYTIRVESNQSVRVYVDGNKVIDTWYNTQNKTELSAVIAPAKSYKLEVEFSKANSGNANIKVLWSSKSQPEEVIPTMYTKSDNNGKILTIMVLEHLSERALNDAKVTLSKDGQVIASSITKTEEGTTGIAYFSPMPGKYRMLVEKQGYYPYEIDVNYKGGESIHTLAIDLIENDIDTDPYVIAVFDESSDYYPIDLAISPSTVTLGSADERKINVMVNWRGQQPGSVVLVQKGSGNEADIQITSKSGIIQEKLGQKLKYNGQSIYVYGISHDGNRRTQLYEIKLIVVEPPPKPDEGEGDEEVKDLIPPLPGFELPFTSYGMFDNEYKFKLGYFTLWQKRDETNIILGQSKDEVKDLLAVGINNFQGKMDLKDFKGIKDLLNLKNTAGDIENPIETIKKWKSKYPVLDTKKTPASTNISLDSSFYLYGERTKNSKDTDVIYKDEFGFMWLGSAAIKYEHQIFVPTPVIVIPCLLSIQGQGKIEARAYYVRNYKEQKEDVAVKIRPEISVEAGFGPGMAKVFSIQVLGQLGIKGEFERFITGKDLALAAVGAASGPGGQIAVLREMFKDGMFDKYYVRGFGKIGFKVSLFMFDWKHYPLEGEVELLKYPKS